MALVTIPQTGSAGVGAGLGFLTASAPSERYYEQRGREPKTVLERAWQLILQLRRWLPERPSGRRRRSCLCRRWTFCTSVRPCPTQSRSSPVCGWMRGCIGRLRLNPSKGRPRVKGQRLPTLQAVAADPPTDWQTVTVRSYGGELQDDPGASVPAPRYKPRLGKPVVPLRWILLSGCCRVSYQPPSLVVYRARAGSRYDRSVVCPRAGDWRSPSRKSALTFGVETQRQWFTHSGDCAHQPHLARPTFLCHAAGSCLAQLSFLACALCRLVL